MISGVILFILPQHASHTAPIPPGRTSCSHKLADEEMECSKSHTVLFNMIAFHDGLGHRWQTQGPRAKSGPPPCFIQPGTLFLPDVSTKLLLNC